MSFFRVVLVVCDGFHGQIFGDQVPHGVLSAAKSFDESPDGLSGVVLCGSRDLLQTAPRPELGLDQFDSPQSDAAVQRHLRLRLPGSCRGAQLLHDKLSFRLIIHD